MLHVQFVFLAKSISLEAIFIVVPFRIRRLNVFCLHVLLTRASLLALAKSIYYYKQYKSTRGPTGHLQAWLRSGARDYYETWDIHFQGNRESWDIQKTFIASPVTAL